MELEEIFNDQLAQAQTFREEGISQRISRIAKIERWLQTNRKEIRLAVSSDLGKPKQETDVTEVFPLMSEIKKAKRNLRSWAKSIDYPSSMPYFGTSGRLYYEPKGVCLIIAPWNYPLLLTLGPLISAIAAGNTIFLKPSEYTPNVSSLIKRMTDEIFDRSTVFTIEGGLEISQQLLKMPFNHIFFTGSPQVGKIVMSAAAENLASVTLELGGKSPTIVDETADVKQAALKVAWGKCVNAGQTCVAPDYVLVHESIKEFFLEELVKCMKMFFTKKNEYSHIVNQKHFDRLIDLTNDSALKSANIYSEGTRDKDSLIFEPMIYTDVALESNIMKEEIFGPIFPVISFGDLSDAVNHINLREKPLALYLFSRSKRNQSAILKQTSSGSVVINDCVLQFAHPSLPFGGVNNSGFGKSHGKFGFIAFSNEKSVLKQRSGLTTSQLLYPPYHTWKNKLIDILIKYF